jgi:hypothetical protein
MTVSVLISERNQRKIPEAIELLVIYKDPRDYPGKFVVRRWWNHIPDREPMLVCDSLEHARTAIPIHAVYLGRFDEDDPAIYEV